MSRSGDIFKLPGRRPWYAWRYIDGKWLRRSTESINAKVARGIAQRWFEQGEREERGLSSPAERRMLDPIIEHRDAFEKWLRSRPKDTTDEHIQSTMSKIDRAINGCTWLCLADIREQDVLDHLKAMDVSQATRNRHRSALRSFTGWCIKTKRLDADPLVGLGTFDEVDEPDRQRRALTDAELSSLLETTRGKRLMRYGFSGEDRWALYLLAAGSGFRRSELASLVPAAMHLDGDPPFVTLTARASKAKRRSARRPRLIEQPLPPSVARTLQPWLAKRPAGERLWPGLARTRTSDMFAADARDAGIQVEDAEGRVIDFHALRHTFITNLTRSGVDPKSAQELARHSTIDLTMQYYTHLGLRDIAASIQGLLVGAAPGAAQNRDTGALLAAVGGPEPRSGHVVKNPSGGAAGGDSGYNDGTSRSGGIGRRAGFKIRCP